MSDSVRPHKWQPTRYPRPWDSPGKNTRVGCHFLLQCMKVKSGSEVVQSCLTLSDRVYCSLPGSSVHGIFQARVLECMPLPSPRRRDRLPTSIFLPGIPWTEEPGELQSTGSQRVGQDSVTKHSNVKKVRKAYLK